jgi:Uncharacterized protein conserved in bacteria
MKEAVAFFLERCLALAGLAAVALCATASEGCRIARVNPAGGSQIAGSKSTAIMEITGYDNGPVSCNWMYDKSGRPVIASGPDKGKPKVVGQTASGRMAKHGTIAADTRYYPFGTIIYVPGYGYGRVEDRGGDIKGPHRLDLWFATEREALKWGRQKNVRVTVWKQGK